MKTLYAVALGVLSMALLAASPIRAEDDANHARIAEAEELENRFAAISSEPNK